MALLTSAAALLLMAASPAFATTVTEPQAVPGTNTLSDVACPTPTTCAAVGRGPGAAVVVVITEGVAGAVQSLVGFPELRGVACSTAHTCVAVGSRPAPPVPPSTRPSSEGLVVSVIDGVLGSPLSVPGVRNLLDVACASATTCYALGNATGGVTNVVTITNGIPGALNPVQPNPDDPYGLEFLACANATTCYGVGGGSQGVVVPIDHGVPGVPQLVSGVALFSAVACSSATTCYSVGQSEDFFSGVLVPIIDGVAGAGTPTGSTSLGTIACRSSTTCLATGSNFETGEQLVVPIVNGALGVPVMASDPGGNAAVACASAATCIAVGEDNPNRVGVFVLIYEPPSEVNACKKGGWQNFRTPVFRNQAACVSYVTSQFPPHGATAGPRLLNG